MGQSAAGSQANASMNYGSAASGNITGLGNAYAAAGVANANANQQLLSSLIGGGAQVASANAKSSKGTA
jgi:hypothetical protein